MNRGRLCRSAVAMNDELVGDHFFQSSFAGVKFGSVDLSIGVGVQLGDLVRIPDGQGECDFEFVGLQSSGCGAQAWVMPECAE